MTTVPPRPPIPQERGRRSNVKTYSMWEWCRAYLMLALCLPFFPIMAFLSGRTLPAWITRKLLRAHLAYRRSHPMDFRIPPDTTVPAYMLRWWRVPRNWALNVYYHLVLRSDDDRALHDHPWWSFSIVLENGYWEHEIMEGGVHRKTWFGPGMMRFRWTGKKAHRLELDTIVWQGVVPEALDNLTMGETSELVPGLKNTDVIISIPATTIFITGPVLRRWGFHDGERGWIDAYAWDKHCDEQGIINSMKMDGGSDAAVSPRNKI